MIFAPGTCSRTADDPPRRLDAPALRTPPAEHAGPGIENLHRIGAGLELPDQIVDRRLDQDDRSAARSLRIR